MRDDFFVAAIPCPHEAVYAKNVRKKSRMCRNCPSDDAPPTHKFGALIQKIILQKCPKAYPLWMTNPTAARVPGPGRAPSPLKPHPSQTETDQLSQLSTTTAPRAERRCPCGGAHVTCGVARRARDPRVLSLLLKEGTVLLMCKQESPR